MNESCKTRNTHILGEKKRNSYKTLVGKPQEKVLLGDQEGDKRIILKWTLMKSFENVNLGSTTRQSVTIITVFQFCQVTTELPQCSADSWAITVTTQTVPTPSISPEVPPAVVTQTSVLAACNCPPNHYWKLHQHSHNESANGTIYKSTTYKCIKVIKS
jgi:hypothetical protein